MIKANADDSIQLINANMIIPFVTTTTFVKSKKAIIDEFLPRLSCQQIQFGHSAILDARQSRHSLLPGLRSFGVGLFIDESVKGRRDHDGDLFIHHHGCP